MAKKTVTKSAPKKMSLASKQIPLDKLIFDPNNYRFQDEDDFRSVSKDKLHLETNQTRSLTRLKSGIDELKKSIQSNGFLEVERVIVIPYETLPDYYVVVEGNRRVAALKLLQEEAKAGLIDGEILQRTFLEVPCLVIENAEDAPFFKEALMGIRHVGGIRQWGGYQRAKLIADLKQNHNLDFQEISERIGLSVQEVARRYRAYMALQQMFEDDEYSVKARASMYPLFHEAVALPTVREWLGWTDAKTQFDPDKAKTFYGLISSSAQEEGKDKDAKIATYQDVRALKDILPNSQARSYLLDPSRTFFDAVTAARQAEISKRWREEVEQAMSALKTIGALDLADFEERDIKLLKGLSTAANLLISTAEKMKN